MTSRRLMGGTPAHTISVVGQSRHFGGVRVTSAFPPISGHSQGASACLKHAISGLVHCSKGGLVDHLVGAAKQRKRQGNAERLCRL
jgi:hypothetical protein